jgi:alkaline phosphatase D
VQVLRPEPVSSLKRRSLITGAGLGVMLAGTSCADLTGTGQGSLPVFLHGVASGDPAQDGVIIWTRISDVSGEPEVEWLVASDRRLRRIVRSGSVTATAERDFCCKVDVDGLASGRRYYYAFRCAGQQSPTGVTRTLPAAAVSQLRFAVASCANYQQGSFAAYARLAEFDDLDAVLHLGDYIYEYGDQGEAAVPLDPSHEILTLADYRRRYAFYRRDAALQACHAAHPFIAVWDDHESANNAHMNGAQNHSPDSEGEWQLRKSAAIRAWHEWMPVREASPLQPIYRRFRYGKLADLIMLDSRLHGREAAARSARRIKDAPAKQLLGEDQEQWLLQQLDESSARGANWRLLGQQVIFTPLGTFNPDQWDGYPIARQRIMDHLHDAAIDNVVVLTGDIHSAWALDVVARPYEPGGYDALTGRGSLAVEFVTPGISSEPLGDYLQRRNPARLEAVRQGIAQQPHLHFADIHSRGFMILEVDARRVRANWYFVDDAAARDSAVSKAATREALSSANRISRR